MPRCQRLISRQSRLLPHILLHQEHYPLISCWNSDDLAASLYLYFKTADSVQHQQYCKIKKQPILLCREIWPYVFFLTLWKIVSCASPDDTVLEVQTTHCKQLLQLCSTPALTLCTLTSFNINKTLPLSQNSQHRRGAGFPCFDSRLPATSGFGPADQEQSPMVSSLCSLERELLCVTRGAAICLAQSWQVVMGHSDSSSTAWSQVLFPPFLACFCSGGGAGCNSNWLFSEELTVVKEPAHCIPPSSSIAAVWKQEVWLMLGLLEPLASKRGISSLSHYEEMPKRHWRNGPFVTEGALHSHWTLLFQTVRDNRHEPHSEWQYCLLRHDRHIPLAFQVSSCFWNPEKFTEPLQPLQNSPQRKSHPCPVMKLHSWHRGSYRASQPRYPWDKHTRPIFV